MKAALSTDSRLMIQCTVHGVVDGYIVLKENIDDYDLAQQFCMFLSFTSESVLTKWPWSVSY